MSESIEFYQNQIALARTEIKNLRQRITSLKYEHQTEINNIKSTLNSLRCSNCAAVATSLVHTPPIDQASISPNDGITYRPIGYIETAFSNKRGVPRQPSVLRSARGVVVIDPNVFNNPEHALSGLAEFSHMWIIFHFHMNEGSNISAKVAPPRLEGERRGVFSTRSPHRPCPIGLSLVKLHSIDGNKIYFNGVDMVNGTPVLDIKPYIPQYDYPPAYAPATSARPRTEGISDAADAMGILQLDDESLSDHSLSPSAVQLQPEPVDSTNLMSRSPEGDISIPQNLLTPISPSPESPSSEDLLDGPVMSPIRRVESERGAPDGQERFTPPQSALNLNQDGIRVASWVTNPPSRTYQVSFSNDALERLNELIGDRSESFKANIQSLLSEDPRSVYVRTRYPDHEYSCVLEDLCISCVFDENSCLCTIIAVRSAEDLQN